MKVCSRCKTKVVKEKDKKMRKRYPWYCPEHAENMYNFEVEERKQ